MNSKFSLAQVEITRIDPFRWALLQIPFGALTGVVIAWQLSTPKFGWNWLVEASLAIAFWTAVAWIGGLATILLLNGWMALVQRGMVVTIRQHESKAAAHDQLVQRYSRRTVEHSAVASEIDPG